MELGYFTMPLHPPGSNFTKTLDEDSPNNTSGQTWV